MRASVAGLRVRSARLWADPLLGALVAAAVALRFATLGQQRFWEDETLTAWELRHHLGTVIANVPKVEASPPLYFVLSWGWSHIFGGGETGVRSLSAVAGVATVPVAYIAARELFSRRAGLVAGALATFSPALVWYSQEARPYALAYLLSGLSFLFFARILLIADARGTGASGQTMALPVTGDQRAESTLRRSCLLWAATSAAAMATHYFTWFLVLVEAIWLLLVTRPGAGRAALHTATHRLTRPVRVAVLALVGAAGCLAPLAIYQRVGGGGSDLSFIGEFPRADRLKEAGTEALFGAARPHLALLVRLAEFVLVLALALLWLGGTRRQRRAAGVCLLAAAVAVILPIAGDFAGARYIDGRYLLMALPTVLVGLGVTLAATRPRWVGPAVALVLCLGSLLVLANVVEHRWVQRQDWRDAAKALGPAPVDRAIVITPALTNPPPAPRLVSLRGVYLKSVQAMPAGGWPVSEIDLLEVGGAPEYPGRVHPRPPLPGFRLLGRKGNGNFVLFRFTSRRPIVADPHYLNQEQLLPDYTSVGLQRATGGRAAGGRQTATASRPAWA